MAIRCWPKKKSPNEEKEEEETNVKVLSSLLFFLLHQSLRVSLFDLFRFSFYLIYSFVHSAVTNPNSFCDDDYFLRLCAALTWWQIYTQATINSNDWKIKIYLESRKMWEIEFIRIWYYFGCWQIKVEHELKKMNSTKRRWAGEWKKAKRERYGMEKLSFKLVITYHHQCRVVISLFFNEGNWTVCIRRREKSQRSAAFHSI